MEGRALQDGGDHRRCCSVSPHRVLQWILDVHGPRLLMARVTDNPTFSAAFRDLMEQQELALWDEMLKKVISAEISPIKLQSDRHSS